MNKLKRWSIRSVPSDVIRGFRTVAFDNDLTIAEVVAEAYQIYMDDLEFVEEDEQTPDA